MGTKNDVQEDRNLPGEGTALGSFANWLRDQVRPNAETLRLFTESLLKTFGPGLPIHVRGAGHWYATLDAIDRGDKQVAALVRLSSHRPTKTQEPRTAFVAFEERGRTLFDHPKSASLPADLDLLLTYSFPIVVSVEENLDLFREFATNELRRLRGAAD